jgi:hypothetical protein
MEPFAHGSLKRVDSLRLKICTKINITGIQRSCINEKIFNLVGSWM